MKKYISILLAAVMAVCCLSACGQNNSNTNTQAKDNNDKQVKVVTTIFPEYDWVKEIAGDEVSNMDLTMLLDNGVDLHSYQPTADDIMKISDCDLFIYVGGESDAWVEDALKEAVNKDMKVINLLDVLGSSVKEEEVVEGMEAEEEEEKDGAEEEPEYDEHVWLSLRNAKVLCKAIADDLAEIDTENADTYQKNEKAYTDKLDELDKKYQETVDSASQKTLLFGDRFPFRYMVDDYDLKYYAAFAGCSAETMAGFETVTFLAKKADELQLPVILTIENSDGRIAEAVKSNTTKKNQKILAMNSLQSVTKEQLADGITYLQVMQENLSVLSEALN